MQYRGILLTFFKEVSLVLKTNLVLNTPIEGSLIKEERRQFLTTTASINNHLHSDK